MLGSPMSERAIATVCRWPPERDATAMRTDGILAESWRSSSHERLSISTSSRAKVPISRPRKRFDTTSRLSQSARSWNTVAMPRARDAVGLGIDDRLAVEGDRSGVLRVNTRENLDQRGLASAVVADERDDLAGENIEVDVGQCLDGTEPLLMPRIERTGSAVSCLSDDASETRVTVTPLCTGH